MSLESNGRRVKRRYRSPQRAEQANATRREILEASRRLFTSRGFGRTTMEAVATEADVSVATVYLIFGNKLALVSALLADAREDPSLDVQQVLDEVDLQRQASIGAHLIRELHERTAGVTGILRSGRGNDPTLESMWNAWQAGHLEVVTKVARHLARRGGLRSGLDATHAADVLYTLTGSETFRQLVTDRGWSPDRFEEWLADSIRRLVIANAAG
ncbi:MAG TPA: helix-turn-helix domain-containing protein [Candidatus Dormibacteraeota bacterium]